jgi:hypothetical protein
VTSAWTIQLKHEYMDEEHSDEYRYDTHNKYEYMYEEHSDEYMDDRQYEEHSDEYIVYMSRANAIRANNMSATNMWTIIRGTK